MHMATIKTNTATAIKAPKVTSSVIWKGPSLLDGKPIVVVAVIKSSNSKTGDMVQTYILREDIDPRDANKSGEDFSICGNCPHRGKATDDPNAKLAKERTCYVVIGQGPLGVFKAYHRGNYGDAQTREGRAAIGKGRMVRIGTYGDGAAVPQEVWDDLISEAHGHTAYSHQFDTQANPSAKIYMRSADSLEDAQAAWAKGQRTFRIVSDYSEMIKGQEIACPSEKGVSCKDCGLCAGFKAAKSIAIAVHGNGAKYF